MRSVVDVLMNPWRKCRSNWDQHGSTIPWTTQEKEGNLSSCKTMDWRPHQYPLAAMGPKFLFNSTFYSLSASSHSSTKQVQCQFQVSTQRSHFTSALHFYVMKVILRPAMRNGVGKLYLPPSTAKNAMPGLPESRGTHLKIQRGPTLTALTNVRMSSWPGSVWWINVNHHFPHEQSI